MPTKPLLIQARAGRLRPALAARLEPGVTAGKVAQRDLERYYHALGLVLADVALRLTREDALALEEATRGVYWNLHTYRLLDRFVDSGRVLTLTPLQKLAVVDALERAALLEGEPLDRLRAVGLVR